MDNPEDSTTGARCVLGFPRSGERNRILGESSKAQLGPLPQDRTPARVRLLYLAAASALGA